MKITGVNIGKAINRLDTLGDVWETVWAEDGKLYTISDDSNGVKENASMIFDRSDGLHTNVTVNVFDGEDVCSLKGRTINHMLDFGLAGSLPPDACTDGCCWKAMGITNVNGKLFISIARHDYGTVSMDYDFRQTSRNAVLIQSEDWGKTWTPSMEQCYQAPMFMGGKFGTPMFLHYGRAGTETAHGSERYVYAFSNNGFWDNGDCMRLGRVAKTNIGRLKASDWEFYRGGDGLEDLAWTKYINEAALLLNERGKCSMTGAQYIEDLDRYIMIQWYYTSGSGCNAVKAAELGLSNPGEETVWDFYESPTPWGNWTKFYSHTFRGRGYYNPCIVSKFIRDGGKKFVVFTNGNFHTGNASGEKFYYRLNMVECELVIEK